MGRRARTRFVFAYLAVLFTAAEPALAQWGAIGSVPGEVADDRFGVTVDALPDIDGDAVADFVVGAPGFDVGGAQDAGKVYVYSGATRAILYEIAGDEAFSLFGAAVAALGDVNGDGVADVGIGAPNYGNLPANFNRGRAFIYSGATGARLGSVDGEHPNDNLGRALANVPNPFGAGTAYLAIGAPGYDCRDAMGEVTLANCGRVYAFGATPTGPGILWTADGQSVGEGLGTSVADAGLPEGATLRSVAAGAPAGAGGLGRVVVLSGVDGAQRYALTGEQAGSEFGAALSGGRDVTADGAPDLLVGAPGFDADTNADAVPDVPNAGKVYVHTATTGLFLGADVGETLGTLGAEGRFGRSVRATRDFNGDGGGDILVGADGADQGFGKVYLYYGASGGLPIRRVHQWFGQKAGQPGYGVAVSDLEDMNGDGVPEVLVGAEGHLNAAKADSGVVYLYSGADAGRTRVLDAPTRRSDYFGHAVAALGDVDGRGGDDFCVGAPLWEPDPTRSGDNLGTVYCYAGEDGALLHGAPLSPPLPDIQHSPIAPAAAKQLQRGQLFGATLAAVGDVDGDAVADFAVGAPGRDRWDVPLGGAAVRSSTAGAVFLYSGADGTPVVIPGVPACEDGVESPPQEAQDVCTFMDGTGEDAVAYTVIRGSTSRNEWGSSIAGAGLVDADDVPDLVVGSLEVDTVLGTSVGRARVYSGATGAVLHAWTGSAAGDVFGISVAGAGDVDNDGRDDVLIGASGADGPSGSNAGRAYVYSGATGALIYGIDGEGRDAFFGVSVSGFADANGDGFDDFLVGASGTDIFADGALLHRDGGRAYLFSGLTGAPLLATDAEGARHGFGEVVARGDFTGDGLPEILVGAPQWVNPLGFQVGKVYVFGAGDGVVSPGLGRLLASFTGQTALEKFGGGLGLGNVSTPGLVGAGDLEGDGLYDLLVASYAYVNNNKALGYLHGRVSTFSIACTDRDGDGFGSPASALCAREELDCDDTSPSRNPGATERCNGFDDDCDGFTDDGFEVGAVCFVGLGACEAEGALACLPDGSASACDAVPGEPSLEICNGVDDDCDGPVDEGFDVGETCSAGVGACEAAGGLVCSVDGSEAVCDAVPGEPSAERCNGVDDDCDAATDEDFGVGAACSVGVGACRADGATVCNAGGDDVICDAVPGEPSAERCNGVDDDCDAATDEDFDAGAACSVGVGACAADGSLVCRADGGGTVCDAVEGTAADEVCNDVDDDCDGETDEDFGVGIECADGFGVCRGLGVVMCDEDGSAARCNAARNPPNGVEIPFTDVDDDCNPGTPDVAATQGEVLFVLQSLVRDRIPVFVPTVGYPTRLLLGLAGLAP